MFCVNRRMFLYTWPFEFNYLTYVLSFVAKPSYNPKKTFWSMLLCFLKWYLDGHLIWSGCWYDVGCVFKTLTHWYSICFIYLQISVLGVVHLWSCYWLELCDMYYVLRTCFIFIIYVWIDRKLDACSHNSHLNHAFWNFFKTIEYLVLLLNSCPELWTVLFESFVWGQTKS